MASDVKSRDLRENDKSEKSIDIKCFHCGKVTKTIDKCIKCGEAFHKSCLKQAATKKSTTCVHVSILDKSSMAAMVENENSDNENSVNEDEISKDVEIRYLKRLVEELEEKNRLLEENCLLWKEKFHSLESTQQKKGKIVEVVAVSDNLILDLKNPSTSKVDVSIATKGNQLEKIPKNPKQCDNPSKNDRIDMQMSSNENASAHWVDNFKNLKDDKIIEKTKQRDVGELKENSEKTENSEEKDSSLKTDPGNEAWTEVRSRKNRRPSPIRGENKNFLLQVAEERNSACLFLSGLHPNVGAEEVKQYIDGKTQILCKCEKMKTRNDRYKSSFKIEIPKEMRKTVMSPDFWGKGVVINHFLSVRRPLIKGNPVERRRNL